MAFGKKGRQGQQQGDGAARRFVRPEDLMKFFAKFANTAEALVLKQAELEAAVESRSRSDIERPMDDTAFRSQVIQIRTQIGDGLKKKSAEGPDWFGPFDGWFKQYAAESYGPVSEFAREHGVDDDWAGRMVYIVLPSQASKHNTLAKWAEFAGVPLVETRGGFRPIYEAVIKKMTEGSPKRPDFKDAQTHLEAKATFDEGIRYFRKTKKDVEEWLAGKRPDATEPDAVTPPRDPKRELEKSLEDDIRQLAGLRKQLTDQTNAGADLAVLSGTMASMKEVQDRIKATEDRLAEMKGESSPADQRLDRAANVVVDEPTKPGEVTGTIGGIKVVDTKATIEDIKPDTLEEVVAKITTLEKQFTDAMAASDRHYAEARALYEAAEKDRAAGKRGAAGKKDVEGSELEESGAKAKQAAAKLELRIANLLAEKTRLEDAAKPPTPPPATPPAAEQKKKVRLAGRKPAAEPVVAAAGAATPNGDEKRGAMLEDITKFKKEVLVGEIKELKEKIGAEVAEALLTRIVKGEDIMAVKEDFDLIKA